MIPAADVTAPTSAGGALHAAGGSGATDAEGNPADLLTAALNGEVTAEELEAVDQALDSMMLGEAAAVSKLVKGKPLLSVEEAGSKLSPEIIKALAEKFKGSLTQVRHMDEQDKMF
ncbi:hypothetical protein QEH52_00880 [Coraliomargarita sp. SDUM461003]|uniref:Uncharacterized protein n=1 Tax=Thalassobacterium maritimum TaxID=3041265 RepID=A0ABU1APF3_9BACT|nr:hypothetical protein [Coraliomargarita sp. SDUM461003]MBT64523.1 hypothetical protein [Puniceicoccaceae bacterium]MDQ8206048.1 hypothetical protein [Coraliomargarita sp. SDUM461003]